ncbi:MAG TPA: hypothetical protein VHS96_17340 [Bacteroidia bacterium]|nr:hypothetical protein [Bacteroidia bacterium]
MKRFNLLLVTQEGGLREIALKTLSKVYKSNFVFEIPSLEEADRLLAKLSIDILMVDLDVERADLVKLSARLPHLQIMGLSANPSRVTANIDPMRHQILEKRDFAAAFLAELKGMKKGQPTPVVQPSRKTLQAPAGADDFKDFSKLSASVPGKK